MRIQRLRRWVQGAKPGEPVPLEPATVEDLAALFTAYDQARHAVLDGSKSITDMQPAAMRGHAAPDLFQALDGLLRALGSAEQPKAERIAREVLQRSAYWCQP